MARIDVDIPEHINTDIMRLVSEGGFQDREHAVEQLLAAGLTAYKTGGDVESDPIDEGVMGHDDEYVF